MTILRKDIIDYRSNSVKILEIEFKHDFFNDGYFRDFRIIPSLKTRTVLKNHNLIFKRSNLGFVIIFNYEDRFFTPLFSNEIILDFEFNIVDNEFLTYTNIPFNYNQLFMLHNDYPSDNLHSGDFVDENVIKKTNKNGLNGLIKLTINKGNEIFSDKELNFKRYNYKINFNSRTAFFRYNFYSSEKDFDFKGFYITNENKTLRFSKHSERILENGLKVFSIVIQQQKKVKEKYSEQFFLIKEDEIFKQSSIFLPHPKTKNISFDKNSNVFYNDVFVKI